MHASEWQATLSGGSEGGHVGHRVDDTVGVRGGRHHYQRRRVPDLVEGGLDVSRTHAHRLRVDGDDTQSQAEQVGGLRERRDGR